MTLTQQQVLALTNWTEEDLQRMVAEKRLYDYDGEYDVAELYVASPVAREALEQLLNFSHQTEGGTPWHQAFRRWMDLEQAGLIRIEKPVHEQTGIQYSIEYWHPQFTEDGNDVVEYLMELIEYHGLREEALE
jgi:hypothetical protein